MTEKAVRSMASTGVPSASCSRAAASASAATAFSRSDARAMLTP